jgi:hypothetical protein
VAIFVPETSQITRTNSVSRVTRKKFRIRNCMLASRTKRLDKLESSKAVMYFTSHSLAFGSAYDLYSSTIESNSHPVTLRMTATTQPVRC